MGLSCKFSLKPIHWDMEWHGVTWESFFAEAKWPHLPHSTGSWIEKVGSRRVWSLSLQKRLRKYVYRPCTCYMPLCSVPFRMVFEGIIGSHGEWSFYERVQSTKKEYQHKKKKQCWFTAWNTIKKGIKKVHWKRALQSGHLRRRAQLWALQRTRIRHIFFAAAYFPTRFDALHHCMFASLHCSLHSPFKHRKKKQSHCIVESKLWQRWPRQASQGSGVAQLRLEHWAFTRCLSSLSSQGLD